MVHQKRAAAGSAARKKRQFFPKGIMFFFGNYLPYEPVIGLSGRARLLPSRKYREIKLGGSLALPDKW
uniref:Uncharacterized protein n=1 Tax=Candidatus Kentrum sp. DK TaxID=2126562 RepID=A0A450RXA5_9GAMM|nr:MAG: hypothetical protein BECKDK2373C_GA0170839_100646 [Candidatus Kentron sp. DK]